MADAREERGRQNAYICVLFSSNVVNFDMTFANTRTCN